MPTTLKIRYYCQGYERLTGYGRAARDYCAALAATDDVELEIVGLGTAETLVSPEPRYRHLDAIARPQSAVVGPCDVEIYHATPRVLAAIAPQLEARDDNGIPVVAMTTWETSRFPEEFAASLSVFDGVIVPSEFCANVIESCQPAQVSIVPHCFDPSFWPAFPQSTEVDYDPTFRFYSIGAWGERKNMLGVLRAYLHAFEKSDPVELMLVIDKVDLDAVRGVIASSGLRPEQLPALHIPTPEEPLREDQLVELHSFADCFVSATRGEGWGLGLFEACISGRHVISPSWGGHADFLDGYSCHRDIMHQLTPCWGQELKTGVVDNFGQMAQMSKVTIPPGVTCKQLWADPNLEQLAIEMRELAFSDAMYDINAMKQDRLSFEQRFGYKTVGPMLASTLKGIIG